MFPLFLLKFLSEKTITFSMELVLLVEFPFIDVYAVIIPGKSARRSSSLAESTLE